MNLVPQLGDCTYTSCYCEENVWQLCRHVREENPSKLNCCFAVFISNPNESIPLWHQKAGRYEDGFVVWDYHVIFLHVDEGNCRVYDLDSSLNFPCLFEEYLHESIRSEIGSPVQFFRVVPAEDFLTDFASDRRHMLDESGAWKKTPPSYSPICTSKSTHNLDLYINMENEEGPGKVYNYFEFSAKFST